MPTVLDSGVRRPASAPAWTRLSTRQKDGNLPSLTSTSRKPSASTTRKWTAAERDAAAIRAAAIAAAEARSAARRRVQEEEHLAQLEHLAHTKAREVARQAQTDARRERLLFQYKVAHEQAESSDTASALFSAALMQLEEVVDKARRTKVPDVEKLASHAYTIASRRAAAHKKNLALIAQWEADEANPDGANLDGERRAGGAASPQASEAPFAGACLGRSSVLSSLMREDLLALSRRLGGARDLLSHAAKEPLPMLTLPPKSEVEMRWSLRLALHALTHNLSLTATPVDLEAAQIAYKSWHQRQWFDPRIGRMKPKLAHGWTTEQYGLAGFAPLYAERLHLPRVAAARQLVLWVLEASPGVPTTTGPFVMADLGAGTCAACVGARIALHEHAGDEQPYRVYPIDVASSGARFASAFRAMTHTVAHGRSAVLPGQSADQFLVSDAPGIHALVHSLYRQIAERHERQPHLLLASFSLQYLPDTERDAFFALLATLTCHPLLVLVIKGVGETQRPSSSAARVVHYGLHYVIGQDRSPRVVEAHLCLVTPIGATTDKGAQPQRRAAPPDESQWAVATYETVERRCQRYGLRKGVTVFQDAMARSH